MLFKFTSYFYVKCSLTQSNPLITKNPFILFYFYITIRDDGKKKKEIKKKDFKLENSLVEIRIVLGHLS